LLLGRCAAATARVDVDMETAVSVPRVRGARMCPALAQRTPPGTMK
jgi:hypothetical protein